ncbi:MAG TPA: SusD/RagB family nutrient-binding outer membrane lipoprotein [Gemmatimonadaceae bacterium]|nr:SusD/RagB family nutrient-binding outer membrane lipoprotein [Gemmatimonadaceae bacterium]
MNIKYLPPIVAGIALAVGMVACHPDQLTSLNTDPNNPTDAPPGPLFTASVNTAVGRWLPLSNVGILAQQWAQTTYPQEDEYINLQADRTSGLFDGPYTGELENLRKIVAKGQALKQPGVYGPAMVLQTWSFENMTDIFGDIPYSDALKGDTTGGSLAPAYDPQKDIYAGFFSALSAATAAMASDPAADPGLGSADPIYGGVVGNWEKFANSLHARLAMRLVNVDPATASAELKAAFNAPGGVFTSNADNAKLVWPGDGVNDNPFAENLKLRDDIRLSRTLMNIMVPSNDPRLQVYAQPVVDSSLFPNGYGGMPNGLSQDSAGKWFKLASRPGVMFYPGVTTYGTFGSSAGLATPSYLMTYAELLFIEAEADERGLGGRTPGQAKADYDAAITASLEQWGITDPAAISGFLAEPAVAYKGGTDGLKQIAVQKWVALFMDGVQAWAEWRRTCQPSTVAPGPAAIVDFVPRRFFYSNTETSVNAENLNAAIARQGPDNFETRMYWDTKPQAAPTYVDAATCGPVS